MSDGVTILAQWLSSWVGWANHFDSLSLFSPLEMRMIIVSTSCIHVIYIHTYIHIFIIYLLMDPFLWRAQTNAGSQKVSAGYVQHEILFYTPGKV